MRGGGLPASPRDHRRSPRDNNGSQISHNERRYPTFAASYAANVPERSAPSITERPAKGIGSLERSPPDDRTRRTSAAQNGVRCRPGAERTRRPRAEGIGRPSGAHLTGAARRVRAAPRLTIPVAAGLRVRVAQGRRRAQWRADDFRSGRSTGWRSGRVTIPVAGRWKRRCARCSGSSEKQLCWGTQRRAGPKGRADDRKFCDVVPSIRTTE